MDCNLDIDKLLAASEDNKKFTLKVESKQTLSVIDGVIYKKDKPIANVISMNDKTIEAKGIDNDCLITFKL